MQKLTYCHQDDLRCNKNGSSVKDTQSVIIGVHYWINTDVCCILVVLCLLADSLVKAPPSTPICHS